MRILITGISGFIGRNILREIKPIHTNGNEIYCVARNIDDLRLLKDKTAIKFVSYDIYTNIEYLYKKIGTPDVLIHLAWNGLPNFQEDFHIEQNLPKEKYFIKSSIKMGVKHIIVTGTCFEYGLQEGCLEEDQNTKPVTKYGIAKDLLRKYIQNQQSENEFIFQWLRLFYPFGNDQNPKSLIPSLQKAIEKKDEEFFIGDSELERDFIPVREVARYILYLITERKLKGIINCCTGKPRKLIKFVDDYCKDKNSKIKIIPGRFKAPSYEPKKFWGSTKKMLSSSFKFENELF